MTTVETIAYVKSLLASRRISDYYLDIYTLVLDPAKAEAYTDAHRGYYYLLTHTLPEGLVIASETNVLQVDAAWDNRTITKIQEFGGQMGVFLPAAGAISEIEFIRAIPRA